MKIRTRFMLGYFAVFAIMIAVSGLMYQSVNQLIDNQSWVNHTNEVTRKAQNLIKLMIDQETGLRGYALTRHEEFLEPYQGAETNLQSESAELRELVSDNPPQVKKLDEIMTLIRRWQQEYALPVIEVTRNFASDENSNKHAEQIHEKFEMNTGKAFMDNIRAEIASFVNVEDNLMDERVKKTNEAVGFTFQIVIVGNILAIFFGMTILFFTTRSVLRQVGGEPAEIARIADEISQGNLELELDEDSENRTGIKAAITKMLFSLRDNHTKRQRTEWLKSGVSQFDETLRGVDELSRLGEKALGFLTTYLGAPVGAFFVETGAEGYVCLAGHALDPPNGKLPRFRNGEGLVGQVALEKRIMTFTTPADYLQVSSGLGETLPANVCLVPLIYDQDEVIGVVELGFIGTIEPRTLEFLNLIVESLAVAIAMLISRQKISLALEKSEQMAEELQAQQEELRVANEELEDQAQQLKTSEEQLRIQQEELQVTNEELEEKTLSLDEQKKDLLNRNLELQNTKIHLEQKSVEVERSSRYKSEFLANMSHELRTPLNSLLILSQDLAANNKGNLFPDQVEAAEIVYNSGNDLLKLINEILDLSKIESGKLSLAVSAVPITEIIGRLENSFRHIAKEHQLGLETSYAATVPETIHTDPARLDQILKNLVSNALKFTEEGQVTISVNPGALQDGSIAIAVNDTGIGIAQENLEDIFNAFQQIDGSISRKFSGTGLGLSISRELTRLLGGELHVSSQPGVGSTFTLNLPPYNESPGIKTTKVTAAAKPHQYQAPTQKKIASAPSIADERGQLKPEDKRILIIEDDLAFAKILADLCQKRGFKFLHSGDGETGLELVGKYSPDAIILDMRLPGIQGLEVLDAIKGNPEIRHIPVHIMSAAENTGEAFAHGAIGFLQKPITQEQLGQVFTKLEEMLSGKLRNLLIVEDNPDQQKSIQTLIGNGDVKTLIAETGEQALQIFVDQQIECIILDLNLPDMTGLQLLKQLAAQTQDPLPPVIIYSARELTRDEYEELNEYTQSIIVKGAEAPARLLDEASLFLHRVVSKLPKQKQQMINDLYDQGNLFQGKKILLVDDDMRNVFAIAKILEDKGAQVLKAANGQKALDSLAADDQIGLVLMDIMMPVMDGLEAMTRIRAQEQFARLPIIALTAKAMEEDRKRCIEAGANDYLSKPVDINRLLSLLRVWMHRK